MPSPETTDATNDDETNEPWVNDIPSGRPTGEWAFYRNGVIQLIPESEARVTFANWGLYSDERGAATFLLNQMWNEIDRLRSEVRGWKQQAEAKY